MRHRKKLNRLGRKRSHRRMLLKNLASSLILHGGIQTTALKAKALSAFIAKLITVAKGKDVVHVIRRLDVLLHNEQASKKLLSVLVKKYEDRTSGFTRITPVKYRKGDNALVTRIELL